MKAFFGKRLKRPALTRYEHFDIMPIRKALPSTRYFAKYRITPHVFLSFFTERRYRVSTALVCIVAVLGGTFGYAFVTRAFVATLYPTVCLGGWEYPQHAEGEPDSQSGYVRSNSAVLEDSQAQLFCSKFEGNIPKGKIQQSVSVHFMWGYETRVADTPPKDEITTVIIDDSFDSSVGDIIDIPEGSPSEGVAPFPPSGGSSSPEPEAEPIIEESSEEVPAPADPIEEPAPAPEPSQEAASPVQEEASAPEPEATPVPEPTAFLEYLFPIAFAQEAVPEAEIVEPEVPEEMAIEASSSEETADVPEPAASVEGTDALLEVLYTLDGEEWISLARITSVYTQQSFEIPVGVFATPEDFSRLQIAVHAMPTVSDRDPIFLDAVWLEIELEDLTPDLLIPPSEEYGDRIISETAYEDFVAVLALRGAGVPAEVAALLSADSTATTTIGDTELPEPSDEGESSTTSVSVISQLTEADLRDGELELWLHDIENNGWFRVAEEDLLSINPRIEFMDGSLFWIGKSEETAWRFNPRSNGYESISISRGAQPTLYFYNEAGEQRALIFKNGDTPLRFEDVTLPEDHAP